MVQFKGIDKELKNYQEKSLKNKFSLDGFTEILFVDSLVVLVDPWSSLLVGLC
jgi:hypothetical protein